MPLLTLPLIAWGSADDVSAYSQSGTAAVTSSVTDPFGGTSAYTVEDNDAGAGEYRYSSPAFTSAHTPLVLVCWKQGTATVSQVLLRDETAAADRLLLTNTWSAGVASVAASTGTALGTVSLGGSWYLTLALATTVVAGNTHRLRYYGATSTASSTGTTSYYVRNMVLLDYVDSAVAASVLRAGSQTGQTLSGVEDAFVTGRDYLLTGQARWIPRIAKASPVLTSGWAGANEVTGVNCGVGAMVHNGMSRNALTFVPDRSACTTSVSCYLQKPATEADIGLEQGGDRTFALQLRSTAEFTGV